MQISPQQKSLHVSWAALLEALPFSLFPSYRFSFVRPSVAVLKSLMDSLLDKSMSIANLFFMVRSVDMIPAGLDGLGAPDELDELDELKESDGSSILSMVIFSKLKFEFEVAFSSSLF